MNANPSNGFEFDAWVDEQPVEQSQDEDYTFDMPEEPLVLIGQYEFVAVLEPDAKQGTVSSEIDDEGNVFVTARPEPGSVFVGWVDQDDNDLAGDGTLTETDDGFRVDLGQLVDRNIIAEFEETPPEPAVWGQFNWGEAVWQ